MNVFSHSLLFVIFALRVHFFYDHKIGYHHHHHFLCTIFRNIAWTVCFTLFSLFVGKFEFLCFILYRLFAYGTFFAISQSHYEVYRVRKCAMCTPYNVVIIAIFPYKFVFCFFNLLFIHNLLNFHSIFYYCYYHCFSFVPSSIVLTSAIVLFLFFFDQHTKYFNFICLYFLNSIEIKKISFFSSYLFVSFHRTFSPRIHNVGGMVH